MMKKWLNIKPKVYDFSADEIETETETESEEEGMVSASCINIKFLVFTVLCLIMFSAMVSCSLLF